MQGRIRVDFGERAQDAGGPKREWFLLLSKAMLNEDYALFTATQNGNIMQPNPNSGKFNPQHLEYFKFIGRIVGKALQTEDKIDAFFTRSFYKHIIGSPISQQDLSDIAPDLYKNIIFMLENDNADQLYITWTIQDSFVGANKIIELKENGKEIVVTDETKHEYVQKICQHMMVKFIKPQIEAFLEGFHDLIPLNLISIFNPMELELMISGLPTIDIEDLKANTVYKPANWGDFEFIKWFWEIMLELDTTQKANYLQFVTGTSKVPIQGFKALKGMGNRMTKHTIRKVMDTTKLPTSHTCFNEIDLPQYQTKEKLRKFLIMSFTECEGFAFG